jgi:hypothetical protein
LRGLKKKCHERQTEEEEEERQKKKKKKVLQSAQAATLPRTLGWKGMAGMTMQEEEALHGNQGATPQRTAG